MKTKQSLLLVLAFVCVFAGSVCAQESQPQEPQSQQTSAPAPNPSLDIQGGRIYLLGPGEPAIDGCSGDAQVGRTPLARGGWYVRAVANRAASLDAVLQRLYTAWSTG